MSDRGEPAEHGNDLPDLATLVARRESLMERVMEAGGDPNRIEIVAVTKRFPPRAVELALAAGFTAVGENYAQELIAKASAVDLGSIATGSPRPVAPSWHMIGGLQRNKIKKLAALETVPTVAEVVFQTIDRVELAAEVAKRLPRAKVFIQVNTTDEEQKSGCEIGQVGELVDRVRSTDLSLEGLMTIGPTDGSDPRPAFETLRRLADDNGLVHCSMGMSADIEAAVEAGSTMIRVGSALFGPRPTSL
jgi:pyridoxal phosphate enzyme (YggS family)